MQNIEYNVGMSLSAKDKIQNGNNDIRVFKQLELELDVLEKRIANNNTDEQFLTNDMQNFWPFYNQKTNDFFRGLPYTELRTWKQPESVQIVANSERIILSEGKPEWARIREEAFHKFVNKDKNRKISDGSAIRLNKFDGKILSVQRAGYFDQVRSNLILDYKSGFPTSTLRKQLNTEYGDKLPPLADLRLANTIGISALILVKTRLGYRPYIRIRTGRSVTNQPLGYSTGGYHVTASGVAKWPAEDQSVFNAFHFFDDQMYEKICLDLGLPFDRLSPEKNPNSPLMLFPVSLAREHQRCGKPQLFYIGILDLNMKEIHELRKSTDGNFENFLKFAGFASEAEEEHFILNQSWTDKKHMFTPEAIASIRIIENIFGK